MQDGNPSFDPKDRGKATRHGAVGVPVKGDSSGTGSNPPSDSDAPTLIDFGKASSDPEATFVDPDATIIEGMLPPLPALPKRATRIPVTAPLLEPGDVLGDRYEIVKLLGEGGMGAVYKAQRPGTGPLGRAQADPPGTGLEPFDPGPLQAGTSAFASGYPQECHPHLRLGRCDGVKFITMEFIEGAGPARALIQEKKKFSPEEAVEIMRQVCQALEAAHSVGVIHRDLKPQNIMRDHTGRILVMDFGLARTMEGDGMTQIGALVGTMEYMSPEQALGKDLDQRSDLFTPGLILYELLTGKMPFKAESALASLIKRTQERAVPVSDHDETIPASAERDCQQMPGAGRELALPERH